MRKFYFYMFLLLSLNVMKAQQQEITVSGNVTGNDTGIPVPGVNVIEKGTSNGVITDFDGNYSIEVSPDAVLEFSFVGYKTLEIPVNNQTELNVTLETETAALDEVIVVGYGTESKRKVTGAVEQVEGEAINKTPVINAAAALSGRAPGLIINQNNSEPGDDNPRILIRGLGTTGNNTPLYVIDGVANRDDLARIDPNDIESVSVLKDASAAIYGAQAANGVILITTKRGKIGKPTVSYSYNHAFVSPTRDVELADASLYAQSVNAYARQRGQDPVYTDEQITNFENGTTPTTDWINEVYKSNSSQERQSLTIRGGGEAVKYFISLGTAFQDGLIRGDETSGFKQYNFRTNLDANITDDLTVSLDLLGREDIRSFLQSDDNTIYGNTIRAAPDIPATINGLPARGREANNPLAIAQGRGYLNQNNNIFNGTVKANYQIPYIDGLSLSGWMAVDIYRNERKHFNQPFTYYQDTDNDGEVEEFTGGPSFNNNFLRLDSQNRKSVTLNASLNYIKSFGDHDIDVLLAYEQNKDEQSSYWVQRNGFQTDQIDQLFAGSANSALQSNNGAASVLTRQNYFGRIKYGYDDKYLAEFLFRYDGSSIFPEGNRFGFFPGVTLGWIISNESFLEDNNVISFLKLRASYGELGNDRVNQFQYLNLFELGGGLVFGDQNVNALFPGVAANPNITWEVSKSYNLGADATFFNNNLSLSANVFKEVRDNILGPRNLSVPGYTGLTLPDENIREVHNEGVELESMYNGTVGEINFYLGGNFTYAKSNQVYLDQEGLYPEEYQSAEGYPVGSELAYEYLGIYRTEEEVDNLPGYGGGIGDPIFRDVNGDDVINNADRTRQELTNIPQIQYGIQIGGDFKGFELNTVFAGQARATQYLRYSFAPGNNGLRYFLETAYDPVLNPEGIFPALNRGNVVDRSTMFYRDISFLRLRSAELAYNLPTGWIAPVGLSSVRVFVSGYNLITWDNLDDDGLTDPEAINIEAWQYPITKNVSLGFNLTF
ncbi:SusC/RagA family TonB-linked outer membrane protein [Autumnicola musiva]|uniref:TonB-dependent receptor n=1 Tax=Autumnicola musiva TaxID=3075589 RepID=A0ABU3D4A8_9FLAO|nr:TonB-dependent receptor [Zunongwangia sp. F117]MDT0675873.1 TonB-dependent receptor [Zunongwangia sp. F117]